MKNLSRIVVGLSLLMPVLGWGQSFDAYMKVRKDMGIAQASGPEALDTFVGQRVLEVAGIIRGYMAADGRDLLILDNPNGRDLYVSSTNCPEWLKNANTSARMIVRATRETENGQLECELVTACAEYQIAGWEKEQLKKAQAKLEAERKAAAAKAAKRNGNMASRAGSRLPGSIPKFDASGVNTGPVLSADVLKSLPTYTAFIQGQNSKLSYKEAENIALGILGYSAKYGVDPRLIVALVICESGFDPDSTSHTGARGLGQLMPGTARELGVSNSYDTDQNLYGTVKLLRSHLDKYEGQTGDDFQALVLALAAYNAGPGAVSKHGGVPPYKETQNYVRKVIATYKRLIGA